MATLTVNGGTVYQTMNGVGSNVNSWSWKDGEITPALDLLVDTLNHSIFRVVHDRMEWAGTGSTRPSTTLTNLAALNSATLQSVYEVADMQDLWDTIAYLNGKGVTGNQLMLNFMGWTAPWMGGSGTYGTASNITNDAQTNQDIATMLASCVYYGHHRRDVSGANANLSFGYLAPFNEPDWDGLEGPNVGASQMNTIYANTITTLTNMGDVTTKIIGPDVADWNELDTYSAATSTAVRARMGHFSFHGYSGPGEPGTTRSGVPADWMTETSAWADNLDDGEPLSGISEWDFGALIGDYFLDGVVNGLSAVLVWEAFDAFYYHHDSYSAWGHIGCTQAGGGCTINDASGTRTYAARVRSRPLAALGKAIRPGSVRISCSTSLTGTVVACRNTSTGALGICGHNDGSSATLSGALSNVGTVPTLGFYLATSTSALTKTADVTVTNGTFTTPSVPSGSFYALVYDMGSPPAGNITLAAR